MNFPRLALAAVVAWLVSLGVGYVVDAYLMADIYAAHAQIFRSQESMNIPLGFAAQLLGFFVFAYMYAKGYEGTSGVQEGLRFGVLVGLLLIGFAVVWNYVVLPVSGTLGIYWVVATLLETSLYGVVVGWLYRPRAAARRA
jgi:hypothetical protein